MAVYTITPVNKGVPAATIVASDRDSIAAQAAAHFRRHKRLSRAATFNATVLDRVGEIRQIGISPLRFHITKHGVTPTPAPVEEHDDFDPTPCCPVGCGNGPCTFPGYAGNH